MCTHCQWVWLLINILLKYLHTGSKIVCDAINKSSRRSVSTVWLNLSVADLQCASCSNNNAVLYMYLKALQLPLSFCFCLQCV
eukprot:m.7070 g.7070  ORF g.7070 m.7070 type:complete len:83 (-) comp5646_c0_seq2:2150-2398(-)